MIERKVENEELGQKTGIGHYDYEDGPGVDYKRADAKGFDTLRVKAVIGNDVATPDAVDIGMRLGTGFPVGLCRHGDEVGLDVVSHELETAHETYGDT